MNDSTRPTPSLLRTCSIALMLAVAVLLTRGCAPDAGSPAIQPDSDIVITDDPADTSELAELARTDQTALLVRCLAAYTARPVTDFTCTFTRREVIGGRLQPIQQAQVKFLHEPFSVAMHWTANAPGGDRVVYVEGLYPNADGETQMVVQPTGGVARFFTGGSVLRLPTADDVLANTLRPITMFGFHNTLVSILQVSERAAQQGLLQHTFDGSAMLNGRPCLVLTRVITEPWQPDIPNRTRIFIDRELLLPVRLEGFDSDGAFMWEYQFDDIRLNPGLTGEDFTPKANDIAPPD